MNFCRIFLFAYKLATLNCLLTFFYMLSNILSLAVYGGFALRAVGAVAVRGGLAVSVYGRFGGWAVGVSDWLGREVGRSASVGLI